jgi:site-specific DNA-methyltransferase (adenine-specific)
VVLGGNMRLTAAKKLGLTEMPCAVLPEDTPIETLKAVVIKDNSSMGAWDFDALANEWDDLPLTDWGVPAWDAQEVGGGQPDVQEDDFNPEDGVLVRCNPGDIWQLGDHRLMCGDSIDLEQVKKLMGGGYD